MNRFLLPLALVALSLGACQTPQANDQDRAGEQITEQSQINSPLRLDRQASQSVTITVTMTGENARLIYQPNSVELTGDLDAGGNNGVQGSTAQTGAGATQTPSSGIDADANLTK